MIGRPLTARCGTAFATRAHACFGVSPFNGYFTAARIAELAGWGLREFAAVHFFVPDVPAAWTLEAAGYPPARAASKARRQGRYVRNKICRALRGLGVDEPELLVLDWAALCTSEAYLELWQEAQELFERDDTFRAACLEASRWALGARAYVAGDRWLELAA